jgi:hypothetical protein
MFEKLNWHFLGSKKARRGAAGGVHAGLTGWKQIVDMQDRVDGMDLVDGVDPPSHGFRRRPACWDHRRRKRRGRTSGECLSREWEEAFPEYSPDHHSLDLAFAEGTFS